MVKKTHVFSLVATLLLFFGRANAQVEPSLYERLGVPSTATPAEIDRAYKKKALKWHPDRNPSSDAKEQFQQLGKAYAILKDEHTRSLYDQRWTVQEIENPILRADKDVAGRRRSDYSKDRSSTGSYGSSGRTSYGFSAPLDEDVDQDWKSEYKKYTQQNASASRSSFTSTSSGDPAGRTTPTSSFAGGKDQWMKEWWQKQAELEAIRAELARRQSTEQSFVKATQAASWQANLSAVHKGSKVASTAKKPNSSANEINQELTRQELTRLRAKKQRMLKSLKGASPDEIDEVLADDPDMQRLAELEK